MHVIQRGNNKKPCFFEESDYRLYLGLLEELSGLHACQVHGYVLMTNHVHLLVTPGTDSAAPALMKDLGQRYVQWINRRHGRVGSLWSGRYWSTTVRSERYVLSCLRYIECNPVRAGIVRHPLDYRWSSCSTHVGGVPSTLLALHPVYLELGATDEQRRLTYRSLFEVPLSDDEVRHIRGQTPGSDPGVRGAIFTPPEANLP